MYQKISFSDSSLSGNDSVEEDSAAEIGSLLSSCFNKDILFLLEFSLEGHLFDLCPFFPHW